MPDTLATRNRNPFVVVVWLENLENHSHFVLRPTTSFFLGEVL
jgi:hypothetical protein